MGQTLTNWRVLVAIAISALLIVGAYALARGTGASGVAQASEETALLQAIASKDSDADGLPDWEEPLYGADPHNPDTFNLGMTDGEAVAKGLIVPKATVDVPATATSTSSIGASLPPPPAEGTLTAAFAKELISLYGNALAQSASGQLTDAQLQNISQTALSNLASSITLMPDFRTASDLKVSGSGKDALRTFAASAEKTLQSKTNTATTSEIVYLKQAVEQGDTNALTHIADISQTYHDMAVGLSQLPVPQEVAKDDLAIINALMHMSELTSDFTKVNSDPLVTVIALNLYPNAVQNLHNAFTQLWVTYQNAGVRFTSGEPGAVFVNLIPEAQTDASSSAPKSFL